MSLVSASREAQAVSVSEVTFATLSDDDIAAYVATGEAMGKAGAYGIQGRAQAFIAHLSGSYSGVMGLPLFETAALLATFGIACRRREPACHRPRPKHPSSCRHRTPRTTSPTEGLVQ